MLEGYFDESGTEDGSPVISVAGYIASVERWRRFDREWKHFLNEEKIGFFHMKDLENYRMQFSSFTPNDKIRLIKRALHLIQNCGAVGFGSSVCRDDFKNVVMADPEAFGRVGSSYCLAAQTTIYQVSSWVHKMGHSDPVRYIFGDLQTKVDGIKVKGELMNLLDQFLAKPDLRREYALSGYAFGDMKTTHALQAADIHAYEITKYLHRSIGIRQGPHRISVTKLIDLVAHTGAYWDRENLEALIELTKS